MTTTLNNDAFDESRESLGLHNYEPHSILYGKMGWTDALDDDTVALLSQVGAIRLLKVVSGVGFETRIYVSVKGEEPR